MGRASQERMKGKTHEQRVKAAQGFSIRRFIKRLMRINKPAPTHYANVSRDGRAAVNPALLPKKQEA